MHDGWYKVSHPLGTVRVLEVKQNNTEFGEVPKLLERGCIFEEVVIVPVKEHERLVQHGRG